MYLILPCEVGTHLRSTRWGKASSVHQQLKTQGSPCSLSLAFLLSASSCCEC